MLSKLLVLLFAAPCLGLKRTAPDRAISVGLDATCALNAASATLPFALAFGDVALDAVTITKQNASSTPEEKKAKWEEAMKEYKAAAEKMKAAEGKLMIAMDALLEVPKVDPAQLIERMPKDNMLVVFYAPWCGHCQRFVLHDEKGDPTNAPLELLNKEFKKDGKLKDVHVVRFDIQAHGKMIPSQFQVQYIPTVYFAHKSGKTSVFEGDPHSSAALKSFAEAQAAA